MLQHSSFDPPTQNIMWSIGGVAFSFMRQGLIYSFGEKGMQLASSQASMQLVQHSKIFSVTINRSIGSIGMRACELRLYICCCYFQKLKCWGTWSHSASYAHNYIAIAIDCHPFFSEVVNKTFHFHVKKFNCCITLFSWHFKHSYRAFF